MKRDMACINADSIESATRTALASMASCWSDRKGENETTPCLPSRLDTSPLLSSSSLIANLFHCDLHCFSATDRMGFAILNNRLDRENFPLVTVQTDRSSTSIHFVQRPFNALTWVNSPKVRS